MNKPNNYQLFYNSLFKNAYTNVFSWECDEILDSQMIENLEYNRLSNKMGCYRDFDTGKIIIEPVHTAYLNEFQLISNVSTLWTRRDLDIDEVAILYDTRQPQNILDFFLEQSSLIQEIYTTINSNTLTNRMPLIIQGTNAQKKSMSTFLEKITNGMPFVFVKKSNSTDVFQSQNNDIKAINTQTPYLNNELIETIRRVVSETLLTAGCPSEIEKRDRVSNIDGLTAIASAKYFLQSRINARNDFINKCKKLDINIKYKINLDFNENGMRGDDNANGKVYDNILQYSGKSE